MVLLYINSSIKNTNYILSKFEKTQRRNILQKINHLRIL